MWQYNHHTIRDINIPILSLLKKALFIILICHVQKNNVTAQIPPQGPVNENPIGYFIKEKKDINYIIFKDNNIEKRINVDSLLPLLYKYIDGFVVRFFKERSESYDFLKKAPFNKINDKIESLIRIKAKNRPKNLLDDISLEISNLPPSTQKVILFLQYSFFNIKNLSYYDDIESSCLKAKVIADQINDLYEKGNAYWSIGRFAGSQKRGDIAIKMFYLALESINESKRGLWDKNYSQGNICSEISKLYESYEFDIAYEKTINYIKLSSAFYSKTGPYNPKDKKIINDVSSNLFFGENNILNNKTEPNKDTENEDLEDLIKWYKLFRAPNLFSQSLIANRLSKISLYLTRKNKKIALLYLLESFIYKVSDSSKTDLLGLVENIYDVYSLYTNLGDLSHANGYMDLEFYLQSQVDNPFGLETALLNKAEVFINFHKYDSALIYANRIVNDTSTSPDVSSPKVRPIKVRVSYKVVC